MDHKVLGLTHCHALSFLEGFSTWALQIAGGFEVQHPKWVKTEVGLAERRKPYDLSRSLQNQTPL